MKPLGTLRFFLALAVLYGHSFRIIEDVVPQWLHFTSAIAPQLGVLMFFTVSGYIICYTVERHYADRPVAFLENRALRIYPVHIACFLFALWVVHDIKTTPYGFVPMISRENIRGIDFFSGMAIFPGTYLSPNPPMWSVFVELQFYLFIGLATFLAQRKAVYWLGGMFVSICTLAHVNPMPWLVDFTYDTYGLYFAFFALGGSIVYLKSRWAWPLFGLSLAAVLSFHFGHPRANLPGVVMSIAYLGTLGVLFWLVSRPAKATATDTFLGGLSYPLYACHVPLLALIAQNAHGVTAWLWIVALCIGFSVALYLAVEKPFAMVRSKVRTSSVRHQYQPA